MPPTGKADGIIPSASKYYMEVNTLKKYLVMLLSIVLLLGISACSEDDNPTESQILGYLLDQFIDSDQVQEVTDPTEDDPSDFRNLYNFEIVASDGYSPRTKVETAGYDLDWNVFKTGYIVPTNQYRTMFFDDITPGAFEVKDASSIRLYRRIIIADNSENTHYKELQALTIHEVTNWDDELEAAIKLSDLIGDHQNFTTITLIGYDGYEMQYTPEEIADGYYLLESERTTFPSYNDDWGGAKKKFKYIDRVKLDIDFSESIPQYLNADVEDADISFTFPSQYDGFDGQVVDLGDN